MDRSELAVEYMVNGYNCAQSVILAYADDLGIDGDTAIKVAAGFGGGMGRSGNICGAVSGAIMALSMKYGSIDPADKAAKENTYAHVHTLIERFHSQYDSITCPGLLCYDIAKPDEQAKARELGLFKTRCPALVRSAAEIAGELMQK